MLVSGRVFCCLFFLMFSLLLHKNNKIIYKRCESCAKIPVSESVAVFSAARSFFRKADDGNIGFRKGRGVFFPGTGGN